MHCGASAPHDFQRGNRFTAMQCKWKVFFQDKKTNDKYYLVEDMMQLWRQLQTFEFCHIVLLLKMQLNLKKIAIYQRNRKKTFTL